MGSTDGISAGSRPPSGMPPEVNLVPRDVKATEGPGLRTTTLSSRLCSGATSSSSGV